MEHPPLEITIPPGVTFADLRLERTPTGNLRFRWAVVRQIWRASHLPEALLDEDPKAMVLWLLHAWYAAHRQHGGPADAVYEAILAATAADEAETGTEAEPEPETAPPGATRH